MGITHLARHDDVNHCRRVHQLRKAGQLKDRHLANMLARCTEADPCRSAACIHCGRDFQRLALNLVEQEIRAPARRDLRGRMSALTVVPTEGCLKPNDLTASACRSVLDDISAALDTCNISPRVLSLDVSFNEDETGKLEPHWCAHGHVLSMDWLTGEQDAALAKLFPKSRIVSRPVKATPLDGRDHGPLYSFKPDRGRRVAYLNTANPSRRPYRDTRSRDLRPWQIVQLAHVEHELGFGTRLTICGIDANAFNKALDAFYHARDGP